MQFQKPGHDRIGGHVRPDGDCVGSCVGLDSISVKITVIKSWIFYLEDIPESFQFIKGQRQSWRLWTMKKKYDLFISLDCGDTGRLEYSERYLIKQSIRSV